MSESAQTILMSFEQLKQTVDQALATQIGNYAQLRIHKQACLNLWSQVEQVHFSFCLFPVILICQSLVSTGTTLVETTLFTPSLSHI